MSSGDTFSRQRSNGDGDFTVSSGSRCVFRLSALGIIICNDSNYVEPARKMADRGARALFIPTNNGLASKGVDVAPEARRVDIARARENRVYVIRELTSAFRLIRSRLLV